MVKKDNLKSILKKNGSVVGPWCIMPSPSVINAISAAGLDFVIIDMEHGPCSFQTAEDMIRAAEVEGCAALVRVAKNDESLILNALDIGAYGVVVPHIRCKADVELAISNIKYYPLGSRGFSSFTRAGRYSLANVKTHSKTHNKKTFIVLILEGNEGIANLDDILTIGGIREKIDVIYIGAYDLSQDMGIPGEVDHPKVRKRVQVCVRKIKDSGIAAGGYVAKDIGDIKWMRSMGMQFITLLPDCTVLFHAFESLCNEFKKVNRSF